MRIIRGLLHLCFACIPGCGQMSQGYMKRGLSQSILFWSAVALGIFLQMEVLFVLMVPLWLYTFFDSYNLRRYLRDGYVLEDEYLFGISDLDSERLTEILNKRHSLIGWALLLVGLYSLYQTLARPFMRFIQKLFPWADWLYDLLIWDMPRIVVTMLIIAVGLWFIRGPKIPLDEEDAEPFTPPPAPEAPPKMERTPWTEAEAQVHSQPEPKAPGAGETPAALTWNSEFEVEKFERPEKEEHHDSE